MEGRGLLTAPALLYASEFPRISITRLSGNSERASFRGPKSPHEGAKWHNFRRSALPRKARSDPFRYFPDSLSRKLGSSGYLKKEEPGTNLMVTCSRTPPHFGQTPPGISSK